MDTTSTFILKTGFQKKKKPTLFILEYNVMYLVVMVCLGSLILNNYEIFSLFFTAHFQLQVFFVQITNSWEQKSLLQNLNSMTALAKLNLRSVVHYNNYQSIYVVSKICEAKVI